MQINTQSVRTSANQAVSGEIAKHAKAAEGTLVSFAAVNTIDADLRATSDIRQAEIERATRLVETSGYPPSELIDRLSRLLADELSEVSGDRLNS